MKITIADAVFAALENASNRPRNSQMLSLLQFGVEERHRIFVDPLYEADADRHVNRWFAGLGPILREELEVAFRADTKAETSFPLDVEIRVDDVPAPDWEHSTPVLPLEDALQFARRPLEIFVEDWQNDGMFFRYIAPKTYASMFEEALRKNWLEIKHGGGIGSLKRRMDEVWNPNERLRLWVMFDSDQHIPGQPSQLSNDLRRTCRKRKIPHHQLERRAIENYLPRPALEAYTKNTQGGSLHPVFKAFSAMEQSHRNCYNMKGGFNADRTGRNKDKERALPEHFDNHRDEPALQDGFGPHIWERVCGYHGNQTPPVMPLHESWLLDDGSFEEAQDILRSLLKRL